MKRTGYFLIVGLHCRCCVAWNHPRSVRGWTTNEGGTNEADHDRRCPNISWKEKC